MFHVQLHYKGVLYSACYETTPSYVGSVTILNHTTDTLVYADWRNDDYRQPLQRSRELAAVIPKRALSRLEARLRRRIEQWAGPLPTRQEQAASFPAFARMYGFPENTFSVQEWPEADATPLPQAHTIPPRRTVTEWSEADATPLAENETRLQSFTRPGSGQPWSEADATPLAEVERAINTVRANAAQLGLSGRMLNELDIVPPARSAGEIAAVREGMRVTILRGLYTECWAGGRVQPQNMPITPHDPTQGSPEYMQSMVAQVSDDTVTRWCKAWGMPKGSTRLDLADRVLDEGPGDLVPADEAADLAQRIVSDVGSENIKGARRADRTAYDRHTRPDTPEDLDHHEAKEPLEDVNWLRDLMNESEQIK